MERRGEKPDPGLARWGVVETLTIGDGGLVERACKGIFTSSSLWLPDDWNEEKAELGMLIISSSTSVSLPESSRINSTRRARVLARHWRFLGLVLSTFGVRCHCTCLPLPGSLLPVPS